MFAFSLIMTATRIQKGALNRAEKSQRYGTGDILDLGLDKEMLAELKWELRTSGVAAYRVGVMRFFGSLPTNFCTHFPRKHPTLNFRRRRKFEKFIRKTPTSPSSLFCLYPCVLTDVNPQNISIYQL